MLEMIIPISIFTLAIAGVVMAVMVVMQVVKSKGKLNLLEIRSLWIAYLYGISILSLFVALYGGAMFVKSALSYAVSPQFSYQLTWYDDDAYIGIPEVEKQSEETIFKNHERVEVDNDNYYLDSEQRESDLINGVTLFISLMILFGVHRFISCRMKDQKDEVYNLWTRAYSFVSLSLYGVLTVVVIPATIYQLLRFMMQSGDPVALRSYNAAVPGEPLAALIFFVPAWLVFLKRMIMLNKKKK